MPPPIITCNNTPIQVDTIVNQYDDIKVSKGKYENPV